MDNKTTEQRSENMRRIRSTGSIPEMIVRKMIHKMGYRYRLHNHSLPGRPDIVLPKHCKIVFVHGCFWHQHKKCKDGCRIPQSRSNYWIPKLERNIKRDKKNRYNLKNMGWEVLVVWECETKKLEKLTGKITYFLEKQN
ncbi:MAG: DNA mismatch endonuclease Vsr [Candidatus Atribacteria bacterium]|nr:DNA mismatch endonuclease Vsr [Candidatus Atribacteria bacterium]